MNNDECTKCGGPFFEFPVARFAEPAWIKHVRKRVLEWVCRQCGHAVSVEEKPSSVKTSP